MTDNGDIFRERIREVTRERIGDYLPNQRNPKIHGELQNERLRAILDNWGKVGVLLTFKDDDGRDVVFDGHARRNQNPDETWYIAKTDLTRQEANELVLMYDPIAALATMDRAQMDGLLREVQTTDASLTAMLGELAADAGLYFGENGNGEGEPVDVEPQVSRKDELAQEYGTVVGQLWQLGEHRLVIGDCMDAAVVGRLLGEERPLLMVTDPPYGIEHDTSWREEAGISSMGEQSAKGIEWDSNDNWSTAYQLSRADVAFVWHASSHNIVVAQSLVDAGYVIRQMVIWNKTVAPFGRSHYSYKHEPCWYAVRKGNTANWHGPNNEVTVWEVASPRHIMGGSTEEKTPHPTQKPVILYERPIANHTQKGDVVYDPFCGSGTMVIAANNLTRIARVIELDPGYAAVAIKRWEDATGGRPKLATS